VVFARGWGILKTLIIGKGGSAKGGDKSRSGGSLAWGLAQGGVNNSWGVDRHRNSGPHKEKGEGGSWEGLGEVGIIIDGGVRGKCDFVATARGKKGRGVVGSNSDSWSRVGNPNKQGGG